MMKEKNINSSDEKRVIYARLQDNIDIHERCELLFDDENEKKLFRERFTINLELQIGVEQYRKLYLSQELSLDSLRKKSKEELDKK